MLATEINSDKIYESYKKLALDAIKYPNQFWAWIKSEPAYAANKARVQAPEEAVKRAGNDVYSCVFIKRGQSVIKFQIPRTGTWYLMLQRLKTTGIKSCRYY